MPRPRHAARDPYTTDPRDPLELIAKLLVGGSYRVPAQGGKGVPLRASDVAAAVAYMEDALEKRTILAVATRADRREIARVAVLAYREVVRSVKALRPVPVDLGTGADRWRLRIAVYDAACELVWPERRRPMKDLAKEAKMRLATYRQLHKVATSVLQEALNDGRSTFTTKLFAYVDRTS